MRRQTRRTVSLGVPGALLASALAAAQTATTTVEKTLKAETPARRAPIMKQVKVQPPPIAPAPPAHFQIEVGDVIMNRRDPLAEMTERFRPYLRLEYHFLRVVCELTQEQRTQIAREAEREFKDAMALYQEIKRSRQTRRHGETARELPDPKKLIQEGLARAAEAHLTPERADRYRQEIKQRADDRKRVIIRSIVVKLDQALILSREQRAQLAERLGSGWDETWFPTEHMTMNPEVYLYRVPSQLIVPLLSEDQKTVWELSFLKLNTTGTVLVLSALSGDFPEDDELTRAREAEANVEELTP